VARWGKSAIRVVCHFFSQGRIFRTSRREFRSQSGILFLLFLQKRDLFFENYEPCFHRRETSQMRDLFPGLLFDRHNMVFRFFG